MFTNLSHDRVYKKLRAHLNKMPIGYPRTLSGVEIDILRTFFTEESAEIALFMDWHFRSLDEIFTALPSRLATVYGSAAKLKPLLDGMARAGAVLRRTKEGTYALVPFIVGMYEFQIDSITAEFYDKKVIPYLQAGFALEYLATPLPQTRTIPVKESIPLEHRVGSWDDFEKIIHDTKGAIAVIPCICRKVADLRNSPCKATQRRELCMVFNDFADTVIREGWGRRISKKEALLNAEHSRKEGLILQPSNEKEPQVVCACCGCCCGLLGLYTFFPRPADFINANYEVEVNEGCRNCGLCVKFCQMKAVTVTDSIPAIDTARCAGCGICAVKCPAGALTMKKKEKVVVPPQNTEELLDTIGKNKAGMIRKLIVGAKAFLGIQQNPRR